MTDWLGLVGGGLLLYFGAEWFVGGASAIAVALRVRQIIIGLTVVAYGTSAPEIIVGIQAARSGHGEVVLGNVVGSNIANIGLILGIAALVKPASTDGSLRRRELPVLILSTAAVPLLLFDGRIGRIEGAVLLTAAVVYTWAMVSAARGPDVLAAAQAAVSIESAAVEAGGAPPPAKSLGRAVVSAVVGLGILLFGGHFFVEGAVAVARDLGMSDRMVGLSIVAVGTSLPELVTSVIAARRGHSDIAVGNVVGSNIFNVLLCLGAAATIRPFSAPFDAMIGDLVALALMTGIVCVFVRSARTITRAEGAAALGCYAAFWLFALVRS